MRYANVNISQLLPIQETIVTDSLKWWLEQPTVDERSVPVVSYGNQYIVCDGHHGTIARLMRGINNRPVKIMGTNEDIQTNQEGALSGYESMHEFSLGYENFWKPLCKQGRINSFQDYLQRYAQKINELNSEIKLRQDFLK